MKRLISYTIIVPAMLLYCFLARTASAAPVEVQSIQILPVQTIVGKYPDISGSVKMIMTDVPGGEQEINIIAVLYRPDNTLKSWTWKNIRMRAGEIRQFDMPHEYDLKLPGTYKVDYNVYSKDMRPLHRLSRTFVADDPLNSSSGSTTVKETATADTSSNSRLSSHQEEHRYLGLGLYGNALNPAGGATILLWPVEYIGLQGTYTAGVFTSAEGRLLIRFPLSSGINPYFGVGYLDVSKEEEIIGVKTKFRDNGVSGVIGVELPLSKSIRGFAEISGAAIELKEQVTNGGQTVNATVDYAPVTIGVGIVYLLF